MREWIPISTSPKGRLALAAVAQFGARPFDAVTVGELAAAADVTTGAIYHHFGSKLGLYDFVRDDVEQRLLDRMEGAIAASAPLDRSAAVMGALVVGFDFAVREGFVRILGDPPARAAPDRLADLLARRHRAGVARAGRDPRRGVAGGPRGGRRGRGRRSRRARRSSRWSSDSRRDRRAPVRSNRDDSVSRARCRRDAVRRARRAARRRLRVGPARRRRALDRGLRPRLRRPPRRRGRHRRRRGDRVHARRSAGRDGRRRDPSVRDRVPVSRRRRESTWASGTSPASRHPSRARSRAGTCSTPCGSTACCRRCACG